ncbi:MAG: aldo/keto reductase [Oscillospiraceae bacterium]|nr:aldo/keto reductase [Oscillospiraceae bacterium]MDD4368067.1 aldo/keto reductase [Oscillospiraceae bacterium]
MHTAIPQLQLPGGNSLPAIGLGTYTLNGQAGAQAIAQAIKLGYRLIDSAFNYENEGATGAGIRLSGVPRDLLQITSKLPGRHQRYAEALATIEESLYRAGLDYYDLYLIHWPNPKRELYPEAWAALLEARRRGLVRVPGVCNFLPEHLERLQQETGELPAVNQIELHPFFNQAAQLQWHREHGIVTEAWSPLARSAALADNAAIRSIARTHDKDPAQIVLRWHVQRGVLPIPKAHSRAHQELNLQLFDFELTPAEMALIDRQSRPDGRLRGQDPATYEEF